MHLGKVYNDGKEVHPQVAGRKIIKKLENSLENNMNIEEVGHKLRDTYGLQGKYLDTALEAYAKGDIDILAKWMDEKHAKTDDGFEALDKVISEENKALDELRIKEGEVEPDFRLSDENIARADEQNFILSKDGKLVYENDVPIELDDWVRKTAGINDRQVVASLEILFDKHKNMFKTRGAVLRAIREIKDNPSHFLTGSNPENAILAKQTMDGKLGLLGIRKNGEDKNIVTHVTKSRNKNELDRLQRRQMEGSPTPSLSQSETVAYGANAHSSTVNDDIISNPNEKINLQSRFNTLYPHPRYKELLEMREDVGYKDTRYSKKQVSKGTLNQEGEYIYPYYEDNPLADFKLTKQDVKELKKGNISEKLLDKLENDLGRLDNDPRYKDPEELEFQRYNEDNEAIYKDADGQEVDKNGHIMFAKGADNILAGALAGFEEDENGNIVFNPYKALLAVGGLQVAKRALKSPHIKAEAKNLLGKAVAKVEREAENGNPYAQAFLGRSYITGGQKEQRGIYNVAFNGKNSSKIRQYDLDILDDYIKYEKGDNKKGAIHIQKHLGNGKVGEVSPQELLHIGDIIRHGKMHIENDKHVYTVFKQDGTRLRVVTGQGTKTKKIISFYSDRNYKKSGGGFDNSALLQPTYEEIIAQNAQKSKPQIEKHLEKTVDEAKVDSPQSAAKTIENMEKSVKLYGGIPAPAFQAVLRPIQKMQKKLIDGIDSFGRVKTHKENVRVEKITADEFLKSTGVNPKTIHEDGIFDGSRFKSDVRYVDVESLEGKSNLEISYDKYEIAFKNGRREFFKLGKRDVYDNTSILSGIKTQIFDQLSDDVVKHIHLNNAYSQNSMKRLAGYEKELSKLKPEDSKTLVHALDGDLNPNLIKNEKLRKAYTQLRDLIDRRAELLSELNMLDKEDIKRDYIKRLYTEYVQEVGFFEALKDKLHGKDSGGGHSGLARNYKRKDMSLEERVKKGQIFHANVVVTATLQAQENQIIKGMFFKKIAENFASVEEIPGYVKVPNDKAFGLLAGKYLPYQVHYSIVKAPIYSSAIDKAYQKAFSHWKVNKTVKNLGTQAYNVFSNAEMMVQSHTSPLAAILGDWKGYIEVGEKYGLIDDTNLAHNLGEIVKKTPQMKDEKNQVLAFIETIAKEAYLAEGTKLGTGARWTYNWGDKLFKVTAMADNLHKMKLKKYEKIHGELSVEESFRKFKEIEEMKLSADEEYLAFKEANELFIDYQRPLPPAIDKLNRYMVPFTNFGWKSTPVKLKQMIKHPLTAMSINLAGGGIVGRMALASATYGGYKGMAEWLKGFVDTGDEEDAYYPYMKPNVLGQRLPFDNVALIPGWRKVGENEESTYYWNQGRLIQGMRADFIESVKSGGMPGQLLGYSVGKDLKTGREFYQKDDSTSRKAFKTFEKMAKDFLPSHFTNIPQKFYDAYMYGENLYGEELNPLDVPSQLLGVRRVNKAKAEGRRQKELQSQIRKVTNVKGRLSYVKGQMRKYKRTNGSSGYSKRRALDKVEQIQRQYEDRFPDLENLINKSNQVEKWSKDYKSLKSSHYSKSQAQKGKALIDNFKKKLENDGLIDLDNTHKSYKPIGKLIDL